ncbi:hypothetical protein B0T19DRAFT_464800 [Cercophora scortea]|uniref:Glucose-methanol-choline oxidoreductase N-terminal domain-containing protein n=1 Tax=Cercophora scortea TaxID=314031 RepID=A0AAE0MB58_9PEZI|nr:hypothetical protein B0T19DRAFT_464800 [Cercophora scortea]
MDLSAFLRILLFCAYLPVTECLFLHQENVTDLILPSYDYIVVGGGIAGLVVANRLSEDPDVTVLILEAGEPQVYAGLVGHGWNPEYDWNITTAPQEFLDNRTRWYNLGHVVGGGSVLNGLVVTRGAKVEYDAWQALGNPGWGWRGLLPYFKKSETFVDDVDPDDASALHIQPDMSVHGTSGPLEVAYPKFFYNQSNSFLHGVSELGIPLLNDANAGVSAGAMIVPATISAQNQSRTDSRTAYLDRVLNRPNLHLASGQTVTRILVGTDGTAPIIVPPFGHLKRAHGVEVVAAAGAILSPVLLQVSGIGPAPILDELNVTVQVDLPGVGQNLQDHPMVEAFYNYTEPGLFSTRNLTGATLQEAEAEYFTNHTGPWTAPLISTTAFPSLRSLTSNWSTILRNISSSSAARYLPSGPGQHPAVLRGYAQQRQQLLRLLSRNDVGALEIMADSVGTLTIANHHPFSRGTVRALSSDILSHGSVASNLALDPRYCSQPEDCQVLVEGLLFNGRIIGTGAMQQLAPRPPAPWDATVAGPEPVNETALLEAVRGWLTTEFHPCGTTSMMPIELGGVVDPRLMVYGMQNLRVVDAGIIPLIPAAHLQAAVYAIAEKAADMIKEDHGASTSGSPPDTPSAWKPSPSNPADPPHSAGIPSGGKESPKQAN